MTKAQHRLDADQALRLIEDEGLVLEAANGPVPTMTHEIVGGRIRGSWWGHPDSHYIYAVLREIRASPDVLVFRLLGEKITLVHRRLWPALVRLADTLGRERLGVVEDVHTDSGHHETVETPFPDWVDEETTALAASLDESTAREMLRPLISS